MLVPEVVAQGAVLLRRLLTFLLLAALLTRSAVDVQDPVERIRRFTRSIEFDFFGWTIDAVVVKWDQSSLGLTDYLPEPGRHALVRDYLDLLVQLGDAEAKLSDALAAPTPPAGVKADVLRADVSALRAREDQIGPLAEGILQEQTAQVLEDLGLTTLGAPLPPVEFRFSRLPMALVVSPREIIRQDANIQISPDLVLDQQIALEAEVEEAQGVSALVVPIGGIGTYPTMVQQTPALDFVAEVVAHEWTHNYLTFRPLGLRYDATAELRTMNETTANLIGKEVGQRMIRQFYPELAPPEPQPAPPSPQETIPVARPAFDFRAEMHTTRVTVDRLLSEGRIAEAEQYMEERRVLLWDHGYRIRRLNQAYFAFYGAYADEPGGPAGEDPVGAAVRALWAASTSPAEFLLTIARMDDYSDLTDELARRGLTIP